MTQFFAPMSIRKNSNNDNNDRRMTNLEMTGLSPSVFDIGQCSWLYACGSAENSRPSLVEANENHKLA